MRVRSFELERAEERNRIVQTNLFQAILSGLFLQGSLSFALFGKGLTFAKPATKILLGVAAIFAVRVPMGLWKLNKLDKYNERFGVKR